jgi:hypothetical protein
MSKVLILADFSGEKATKTTAELATAGARIGEVTAIVLAAPGKGAALAATVNQGPIAHILIVESDDFAAHGVAAAGDALASLVKEKSVKKLLHALLYLLNLESLPTPLMLLQMQLLLNLYLADQQLFTQRFLMELQLSLCALIALKQISLHQHLLLKMA